jgi:hypothetical protein
MKIKACRSQSEASTSPGTPGAIRKSKKQEWISLEPSEGEGPGWYPGFRLLASGSMNEYVSVILNHQVCVNFLWKPWETKTSPLVCFKTQANKGYCRIWCNVAAKTETDLQPAVSLIWVLEHFSQLLGKHCRVTSHYNKIAHCLFYILVLELMFSKEKRPNNLSNRLASVLTSHVGPWQLNGTWFSYSSAFCCLFQPFSKLNLSEKKKR